LLIKLAEKIVKASDVNKKRKEIDKEKKKDEVKEEKLPQSYKSETFEEPSPITQQIEEPWNPLGPKEEDDEIDEEPCEECLEENIKTSWAKDEETIKKQEESLMQELGVKQAEHQYQVAKDVKIINALILICRRLGALQHIEERRLKFDKEYVDLVKQRMNITKKPDNPYEKGEIYERFPETIRHQLNFDYAEDGVRIRPKAYLGKERWSEVMQIVKSLNGEWLSKGKNSYWLVP